MSLTPDADLRAKYEKQGYLVVEQLIEPDEAGALKEKCKAIRSEVRAQRKAQGKEAADDPSGVFVGLAARDDAFKALAQDPRIVGILSALIGPDVTFLSDKYVYKESGVEFGSPWHQDWPYWQGSHKLSVWVALDPATPENGCLRVIPGSHTQAVTHGEPGEDDDAAGFVHRLHDVPEDQAVDVPLRRGGAVLFHDLMLHASHPNTSGQERWSVISTYVNTREHAGDPDYSWAVARMEVSP